MFRVSNLGQSACSNRSGHTLLALTNHHLIKLFYSYKQNATFQDASGIPYLYLTLLEMSVKDLHVSISLIHFVNQF
jgi:hypothetical protein